MEFAFDDDVFETKIKPASQSLTINYEPKIERPGYFLNPNESDGQDALDLFRMKANYYFLQRNFQEAFVCYEKCYEIAISGGAKFEFLESQVRCCLQLKTFDDASRLGLKLFETAANFDQQIQALFALKDVFDKASSYNDCVLILAVLLNYFDTNPQFWLLFGRLVVNVNAAPSYLNSDPSARHKVICIRCRAFCQFASFIRCLELIKVLQIDGERLHLRACASRCDQLIKPLASQFDTNDFELAKIEMCKDITKIFEVCSEKVEVKHDGRKIDESFVAISNRFMLKWFNFVFDKCPECRKIVDE